MNYSSWPASWTDRFGASLPSSYLVFDIETTGFSKKFDLIVEIGHCLVEDGVIVDKLSLVLDWTKHPIVPQHWLVKQLEIVRSRMAENGVAYCMTMRRMREEGVEAIKALKFYHELFTTLIDGGSSFVAHNGYRFDEDMLACSFAGFEVCKDPFSFGDFALFDTEAIEKSLLLPKEPRILVRADDTLREWSRRANYTNLRGVKTKLAICAERYKLPQQHGINLKEAHNAGFDAYLTHLVFEEQRKACALHGSIALATKLEEPSPSAITTPESTEPTYLRRKRGQRNR